MTNLLELADRVEAETPNRMLDSLVAKALNPHLEWVEFEDCWCHRDPHDHHAFNVPAPLTSDANAALALLTDNVFLRLVGPTGGTHVCRLALDVDGCASDGIGMAKGRAAAITSAALRLFDSNPSLLSK